MIICLVILVSACGYNENDEADEDMSIQVNAVRKSEDANSIGNEPDEKMQTWQILHRNMSRMVLIPEAVIIIIPWIFRFI